MSELEMDVLLPHTPREVFAVFEDSFRLRRWYGAPPSCFRTGAEGGMGPGTSFRVDLLDADGARFAQLGRIVEVQPNEGIELDMSWQGGALGREQTRVSIRLRNAEPGTRMEIRQGPFSSAASLEAHQSYWRENLKRLARVLAGEALPCYEEFWEESLGFVDPLAVATYAVLAGLREAGTAPALVRQVEDTLYSELARLPEEMVALLGAVLRERMKEPSA